MATSIQKLPETYQTEPGTRRLAIGIRRNAAWTALAFAMIVAVGCASSPKATPTTQPASLREIADEVDANSESCERKLNGGAYHRVRSGQTLYRIAKTYEIHIDEIILANKITDPNQVDVGRLLWIPGAEKTLFVPATVGRTAAANTSTPSTGFTRSGWMWPLSHGSQGIISTYGVDRGSHTHKGLDIRGRTGQPVLASRAGVVRYSDSNMRGYGKTVILDHGQGWTTLYAHNSRLLVSRGDRVEAGQPIARVGRSGNATTEHVHFEIRREGRAVDPQPFLASVSEESQ